MSNIPEDYYDNESTPNRLCSGGESIIDSPTRVEKPTLATSTMNHQPEPNLFDATTTTLQEQRTPPSKIRSDNTKRKLIQAKLAEQEFLAGDTAGRTRTVSPHRNYNMDPAQAKLAKEQEEKNARNRKSPTKRGEWKSAFDENNKKQPEQRVPSNAPVESTPSSSSSASAGRNLFPARTFVRAQIDEDEQIKQNEKNRSGGNVGRKTCTVDQDEAPMQPARMPSRVPPNTNPSSSSSRGRNISPARKVVRARIDHDEQIKQNEKNLSGKAARGTNLSPGREFIRAQIDHDEQIKQNEKNRSGKAARGRNLSPGREFIRAQIDHDEQIKQNEKNRSGNLDRMKSTADQGEAQPALMAARVPPENTPSSSSSPGREFVRAQIDQDEQIKQNEKNRGGGNVGRMNPTVDQDEAPMQPERIPSRAPPNPTSSSSSAGSRGLIRAQIDQDEQIKHNAKNGRIDAGRMKSTVDQNEMPVPPKIMTSNVSTDATPSISTSTGRKFVRSQIDQDEQIKQTARRVNTNSNVRRTKSDDLSGDATKPSSARSTRSNVRRNKSDDGIILSSHSRQRSRSDDDDDCCESDSEGSDEEELRPGAHAITQGSVIRLAPVDARTLSVRNQNFHIENSNESNDSSLEKKSEHSKKLLEDSSHRYLGATTAIQEEEGHRSETEAHDVSDSESMDILAENNKKEMEKRNRNKKIQLLSFGSCILIIIIIVVVVFVLGGDGGDTSPIPQTNSPTEQPTMETPTAAPTRYFDKESFINLLGPIVGGDAKLRDTNTPHYQAMEWLATVDPFHLIPTSSESIFEDNGRLIQRYIVALLYYSTRGTNWNRNRELNFLSGEHECHWNDGKDGIFCNNDDENDDIIKISLPTNNLSGSIPIEIAMLVNLQELQLNGNGLVGTIPTELLSLPMLTNLALGRNFFSETIPSEIGKLSNLKFLQLDGNDLTGAFPPQIGLLTNLISFSISSNRIEALATELGALTSMISFSAVSNNMQGTLPSELGLLNRLAALDLSRNYLSGEIPTEFGNLQNLEQLFLQNNILSGVPPMEIANLPNLKIAKFGNNDFDELDPLFCESDTLKEISADCKTVSCSCCTECCDVRAGCMAV